MSDETEQEMPRETVVNSPLSELPRAELGLVELTVQTHLRQLVLDSKKGKPSGVIVGQDISVSETDHRSSMMSHSSAETASSIVSLTSFHCSSPESYSESEYPESSPPVQDPVELEKLAVSFITETIQAIKPPSKPSAAAAMKLELLTRQQQLEKEIAESKLLMARLTSAQTKQEKDEILQAMRERTRCVSDQ